jgi:hypothetical protein
MMPAVPHLDGASARVHEAHGMASLVPRNTAENAFEKFAVEAWTLLTTALAITALRVGFRISTLGIRNLGWDDYLVCVGTVRLVLEIVTTTTVQFVSST